MKKRLVALGLVAALGTVGVMGQQQAQLEFVTTSLAPTFNDFFNPLVERANRQFGNVKWTDLPQNAIQQRILAGVAAGNPPEAVQLNSTQILELAQQGALLPLDDLISSAQRRLYQDRALAPFTYEGKLYALPDYASTRIIAFNTDILRRAGLDASNPPRTIPGIIEWAKQIKDRAGVYGFAPLIANVDFLKTFQEAGLPIFSADRKRAVFNSPAHVALLQQYVDLRRRDYFPEDVMRRGFTAAYELYTAGRLGILIVGPQFMPRLERDNNAIWKTTVVAPHPVGPGQVVQASTFAYAIPKGARDPKRATELVLWLTSDDNQLAFSKRTGTTFPTTVKAAGDAFFTQGGATVNEQAKLMAARTMRFGRDLTVPVPNAADLNKAFKDNVEAAIFGQKSAKQALDDIVRVWNAAL
jgi:putative chitobiose transport system substrate-binding protein